MSRRARLLSQIVATAFLVFGFVPFFIYSQDRIEPEDILARAAQELSVGDRSKKIQRFYESLGAEFDYFGDFAMGERFYASVYGVSPFTVVPKRIKIVIRVDNKRRFLSIEAEKGYPPWVWL